MHHYLKCLALFLSFLQVSTSVAEPVSITPAELWRLDRDWNCSPMIT